MNIFQNAERTVVESYKTMKSTGSPLQVMSESAASNSKLREMQMDESYNRDLERYGEIEKNSKKQKLFEGVLNRELNEIRMENMIGNISTEGKEMLFKDILFETFYNALLMDADFLEENKSTIKELTDKCVVDNGGYKWLTDAIDRSKSELLKSIKTKIDKIVMEVCARKMSECKANNDPNVLMFNLNAEEKEKFDYAKGELNIDQISNLVKDKVLTVIKDEKQKQEEEAALIQDIENDLIENEEVSDEKSLNEALQTIVLNKPVVEDTTLFDALFRNSYQEYLTENIAIVSADHDEIMDDKENARDYDPNIDEDDLDDTADSDDTHIDDELNMDIVLTEAITKYTLMETLYTLKLENYTHENMQKLVHKLVNRRK